MPSSNATDLHPATPRKRQRARAEGHVAKSRDLTSALVLIGGLVSILLFGNQWRDAIVEVAQRRLGDMASTQASVEWLQEFAGDAVNLLTLFLIPAILLFVGLPLVVHLIQTRFLLHLGSAMPNWSRMGFAQWKNRAFTAKNMVQFLFNLAKLLAVIVIATWFFTKHGSEFVALATVSSENVVLALGNLLMRVILEISIALLVLAAFDLFYQRRKYERDLMMTAEELREESQNR